MTTRNLLIDTMKTLLWQRGYDATSPNQVLEASGVGKGSLYHHFKSKKDLAIAAMDSRADEAIKEAEKIFKKTDNWLDKFKAYILTPRDGLIGCRLGRIAHDPSITDDISLQQPIRRYFTALQKMMVDTLNDAQEAQQLPMHVDTKRIAFVVISAIQGSFVVSRSHNNDLTLETGHGIIDLLELLTQQ